MLLFHKLHCHPLFPHSHCIVISTQPMFLQNDCPPLSHWNAEILQRWLFTFPHRSLCIQSMRVFAHCRKKFKTPLLHKWVLENLSTAQHSHFVSWRHCLHWWNPLLGHDQVTPLPQLLCNSSLNAVQQCKNSTHSKAQLTDPSIFHIWFFHFSSRSQDVKSGMGSPSSTWSEVERCQLIDWKRPWENGQSQSVPASLVASHGLLSSMCWLTGLNRRRFQWLRKKLANDCACDDVAEHPFTMEDALAAAVQTHPGDCAGNCDVKSGLNFAQREAVVSGVMCSRCKKKGVAIDQEKPNEQRRWWHQQRWRFSKCFEWHSGCVDVWIAWWPS